MERSAGPGFGAGGPAYSVTVTEILRLALPPGSAVLVGHRQLARNIYWARLLGSRHAAVGSSEAGEMVLLPSSAAEGRTFGRVVTDLADAGVAAFLVAGDPNPDGLEAAEQAGAPVLRLAASASLVEAERSIISLIVDRESQLRRRVEHVYEQLLTTLVDDAGIGQLTSEVAEVTGRPAVVLDEYFRVFVTEPNDAPTRALGRALGTALAERDPRVAGAKATAPLRLAPHDDGVEALLVPLSLRGTPAGYLALGGEETISELDLRIAERAARVLGIELAKQRAVTEAQLRLQGDFLEDLLSGGYPSEEAMLARARWMGHDLTRPHVVLALAVDEPPPTATVESRRMRAADIVRTEVMRVAAGALVREQQGAFDVAIPQATPPDHAAALALAERVREQLERLLVGATVTVGVGRSHPGVRGLARAYREAEQALAIARALLGGGQTIHFEDLGVQRLLFQLRDNPELASFYEDMLGRLQAHDERQGAELVSTLEAFFDCHGNHVRTAQRLHLHRNTLLYRLDRVRQVLGVDLDDPEMRLALQVALKIGRVIGRRRIDGVATAAS